MPTQSHTQTADAGQNGVTHTREAAWLEWRRLSESIRARGARLTASIHDRGWKFAASVGVPRDLCCLHNASIDDDCRGWCKDSPERLRVAKLSRKLTDDWTASRLADALIARLFNRMIARPFGYGAYDERSAVSFNPHILFRLNP